MKLCFKDKDGNSRSMEPKDLKELEDLMHLLDLLGDPFTLMDDKHTLAKGLN